MKIKDLKTADVLLFSPEEGSFISWAITYLTDAPVSHAAMYYSEENKTIIEETPPQVAVNVAEGRFKGRKISVRRFDKDITMRPVLDVAKTYLNNNEPYDKNGLYMIGILLIYKKFAPHTLLQKVIIKILKKLTVAIVKEIQKHEAPGKSPMVCSQFVAQCYDKAGVQYHLNIVNGVLENMALKQGENNNLIEQVLASIDSKQSRGLELLLAPELNKLEDLYDEAEDLCKELKDAFDTSSRDLSTNTTDELVEAVSQFAHALYLMDPDQAENGLELKATDLLANLKDNENMFTFPGDLLSHTTNLLDVGTIE